MKKTILAALLVAGSISPAFAQGVPNSASVVATCGSATYTAGQNRPLTQDTTGSTCTTPSNVSASNVNLTGINGVAPSVGNGATDTGTLKVTVSNDSTGQIAISQATPGTTNGVQTLSGSVTNATLQAGTAIIGKVAIDQTTPGTTNGVQTLAGSTTAVTQPTAANLNATVVQATASNLNAATVATPSATVGITTQSCTVACASTNVSGAHAVYGISFSATVTGWLLVYDSTTCSANGTVTPKKAYAYTVANTTIGVSWGSIPMINSTGISACFSTTGPYTATASTTAFVSVDYK